MSVQIQEYQPSEQLRPYVEFYWQGDFNAALRQKMSRFVVPNGYVELVIHLSDTHCELLQDDQWISSPDYTVIGLYTRPYEVHFPGHVRVFGIRFKPEGIYNLFGIPASLFKEGYEDMELVLGRNFQDYCSRLRETGDINKRLELTRNYLFENLSKQRGGLTYINRAAEMIRKSDGFEKIDELSDKVYISLRQLEREFKYKIGITPKRYMRISRLNEVHRQLEDQGYMEFTKVAYDCGYSDQAHFIRDFKTFMGVKPTIFVREKDQFIINSQLAASTREIKAELN